jgi:hypothetical protein
LKVSGTLLLKLASTIFARFLWIPCLEGKTFFVFL